MGPVPTESFTVYVQSQMKCHIGFEIHTEAHSSFISFVMPLMPLKQQEIASVTHLLTEKADV